MSLEESATETSNGRVTIPKEIRDALGIEERTTVTIG